MGRHRGYRWFGGKDENLELLKKGRLPHISARFLCFTCLVIPLGFAAHPFHLRHPFAPAALPARSRGSASAFSAARTERRGQSPVPALPYLGLCPRTALPQVCNPSGHLLQAATADVPLISREKGALTAWVPNPRCAEL